MPGVEIRVVDGELQVRSPSAMQGYLPPEDAVPAADGWYRTGDVGHRDADGFVHITGRAKELIKVKGFQVAPAELEAVLLGHCAVLDCAVFGVPDKAAGEAPVAAVQIAPGAAVTPNELSQRIADTLAG